MLVKHSVTLRISLVGQRRYASSKQVLPQGPAGRSAVSGHVATVFGCTGFLGRYVVAKLAKAGTQVIVPYRDEDAKRHLKVTGDLGQIVPMEWDIRNEDQIAECVRHSDIVYNLVGRDWETRNFDFDAVHARGAETIARVAAEMNIPRMVHVSHLNASLNSPSIYYQSKAKGEELVKNVFPNATILRPGPMYGHEDRLLRSMAVWPVTWNVNDQKTLLRPAHVLDVASALAKLTAMSITPGTLSLPGPTSYSLEYLMELVSSVTYNPPSKLPNVPKRVAKLLSRSSSLIWWPTLTPDEVERRYIDDATDAGDWDQFDIVPEQLEHHALTYLQMYRSSDNLTRPLVLPERDSKGHSQGTYRVIE